MKDDLTKPNPFRHPAPKGFGILHTYTCDADSRIRALGAMNAEQLRQVLDLPDAQRSVRSCAAARLRRLEREDLSHLKESGR
jgi:hypothetical protein